MRNAFLLVLAMLSAVPGEEAARADADEIRVPILAYHRFGPVVQDNMTVTTPVFVSQLESLRSHGYTIISLRQLVAYISGDGPAPPPRSAVITVDDGHKSVFTDLFPLIVRERIPVTLFIYPSAISNASYALTWAQLRQMQDSGLVDIQSHTFWHPNFNVEKKRLAPAAYEQFVRLQLTRSKAVLERRLGGHVDMLAWPYGIYDAGLLRSAQQAGYVAAFTLERRPAGRKDDPLALPRYLMTDAMRGRRFASLLAQAVPRATPGAAPGPAENPGHDTH